MRFLRSFSAVVTTLAIGTSALDASILTFESQKQWKDSKIPFMPDDTLQHVLELRMGSSTKSALGRTDESTIELISRFAGSQTPLFRSPISNDGINNLLVIVAGISDEMETLIRNEHQDGLIISSIPTMSARDYLWDSLLQANTQVNTGSESRYCSFGLGDGKTEPEKDGSRCHPQDLELKAFRRLFEEEILAQISIGELWLDDRKSTAVLHILFKSHIGSGDSLSTIDSIKSLFADLRSLAISGKQITAVITPNSKGSQESISELNPRDPARKESFARSRSVTDSKIQGRKSMTPLSVAPVCHASNSSCNEATNTCSGHGFCYRKPGSESERETGACYSCQCYETFEENKDGTKQTLRWAGAACHKRDVSSPFFLIAAVTIAVVVAISTAIGMIYQVGNGELPGVISAGVGSARAQK